MIDEKKVKFELAVLKQCTPNSCRNIIALVESALKNKLGIRKALANLSIRSDINPRDKDISVLIELAEDVLKERKQ
jgi:hypothetical protein